MFLFNGLVSYLIARSEFQKILVCSRSGRCSVDIEEHNQHRSSKDLYHTGTEIEKNAQ